MDVYFISDKGTEIIHGKCDKKDGEIMYREEGNFNTPGHAIGLYGVSNTQTKTNKTLFNIRQNRM